MIYSDFLIILPELILIIFCLLSLLVASFFDTPKTSNTILLATIGILIIVAFSIYFTPYNGSSAFEGAFVRDSFAQYLHAASLQLQH